MINMILTIILLLMLLFLFSINSKETLNNNFGSFYHTGIAKGIAVFMILISHIGDKSGYRFFTPLGGIGVSIFIICSGYGLYKSYLKNGLTNYFRKRFVKLLIPYWIVFIGYSIFNFQDFITLVKGFTLIEVPSIFWYVQYIVIMYIAFYIIFRFFNNLAIGAFFIFSIILFIVNRNLLLGEQSFAFVMGLLLAKINISSNKIKIGLVGASMIILGGVNLVLKQTSFIREFNYLIMNLNGVFLKSITALGIILLIYSTLKIRELNIFTVAGKYSYEIYLVQISLVEMLVGNFTLINIFAFIALTLIGTLTLNIVSRYLIKSVNNSINQLIIET